MESSLRLPFNKMHKGIYNLRRKYNRGKIEQMTATLPIEGRSFLDEPLIYPRQKLRIHVLMNIGFK